MNHPRTVISGLGAVCSLGPNVDAFWRGLMARECGIRPLTRLDPDAHRIPRGGEAKGFILDPDDDEAMQFVCAAAEQAVRAAGLDGEGLADTAVVLGTNFGALTSAMRFMDAPSGERAGALFRDAMLDGPVRRVAGRLGAGGPLSAVSLSCCSGNAAFALALDMIRTRAAERVVAGGYDAITDLSWSGLAAMRTMTTGTLRPFDKRRDGTIFSEGAGVVMIETLASAQARGAAPLVELLGGATDNNAYHMAHPDPGAEGMARVMAAALRDAGVEPGEMDYVSAHGTGTKYNDKLETLALKKVLGTRAEEIPVVSIKSYVGHAMGAASALEVVATVRAMTRGRIPATINLEEPDPECDLDYCPDGPRDADIRVALCNSAGIGGPNAAVVLRKLEGES